MMAAMRRRGAKPSPIANATTLLHQIFAFGLKRGLCATNPCAQVDRHMAAAGVPLRTLQE